MRRQSIKDSSFNERKLKFPTTALLNYSKYQVLNSKTKFNQLLLSLLDYYTHLIMLRLAKAVTVILSTSAVLPLAAAGSAVTEKEVEPQAMDSLTHMTLRVATKTRVLVLQGLLRKKLSLRRWVQSRLGLIPRVTVAKKTQILVVAGGHRQLVN